MTSLSTTGPVTPGAAPTCRVTVVTPYARVDVALPVQATLAELIPQLIRLVGAEGQSSAENPGWVLARLGGAPFPVGLTVTAAAIRDGDVLYLNPRERQVAPLLFDDVIDAIASAAESRAGAWGPKAAYRSALTATAILIVGATLLLLNSLWGSGLAPIALGTLAAAVLVGGGALARAYGDAEAGAVCAGAGVPAALLAGATVLPPHVFALGAGQLAAGLGVGAVYGVLVVLAVAARLPWFLCLAVSSALGALAAAVVLLANVHPIGAAGFAAAIATALAAVAPMISLRLARLPLPRVPAAPGGPRCRRPASGAGRSRASRTPSPRKPRPRAGWRSPGRPWSAPGRTRCAARGVAAPRGAAAPWPRRFACRAPPASPASHRARRWRNTASRSSRA